ncbi:MAG TPA: Chromate resistance protein ChrB [Actinomycetota bacterium]|nr:Chromate resistance protein ChrB [Actinomycetota bacterium]
MFTDAREGEWTEFLTECVKFDAEIKEEIRIGKFTTAELDEEEQNLDRLRRWFRELRGRDVFVAPSQETAERRLKESPSCWRSSRSAFTSMEVRRESNQDQVEPSGRR